MKEHTESISEIIFTHFPSSNIGSSARNNSPGNQTSLFLTTVQKQIRTYWEQLQSGAATLVIGTVVLITVYFFLTQLAEYGWQ